MAAKFDDAHFWLKAESIEPAPLRIEAGKYYRTRDGRKVGPMAKGKYDLWGEKGKSLSSHYSNGRMSSTCEYPGDLIAEWPADTIEPAQAAPRKFKVGVCNRAIVARHTESGEPRPSLRPYVHDDTEAATREAARLAKMNPGVEFGVYELVGAAKEAKVYEHEWQRLAANGDKERASVKLGQVSGLDPVSSIRAVDGWLAHAA